MMYSYQANPVHWFILVFIAISVISSIVKKLTESGQNPPSGSPGARPARKSFTDLIEEVRKMANEGHAKPPSPPKPPKPTTVFTQQQRGSQPEPTVLVPIVPKLKTIGQVRQLKADTVKRFVVDEEDERARAEREKAKRIVRERKEQFRREQEKKRQEAERFGVLKTEKLRLESKLRKRYEKPVPVPSAAIVPGKIDYSRILKSREALRNAIVLREIFGPPRSMRRYRSRQH